MAANQDGDKFVSTCGLEFSQVTVVGIVRSVNESATRVEYEIDDYTGPYLSVKMFVEDQVYIYLIFITFDDRTQFQKICKLVLFTNIRTFEFMVMFVIFKE